MEEGEAGMVQEFLYRTAIQVSVGLRPAYPCPSLSQGESGRMCSEKAQCPAFTQWEVSDCSFWSSWHSQGAGSSFPGKDGRRYPDTAPSKLRGKAVP